jgi:hypothetical protein
MSFDLVKQKDIIKRFEDEDVQYRLIHVNNIEWVIWEEKDTAKVEKIIYDVVTTR